MSGVDFMGPPAGGAAPQGKGVAEAMAGFGEAPIDVREPFPPVGLDALVELVKTESGVGREVGFHTKAIVRAVEVFAPGGGEDARTSGVKSPNLLPGKAGQLYTLRISGFANDNSKAFAYSDLKQQLIAIMEHRGMTAEKAAALTPQQWNQLAVAYGKNELGCEGARFYIAVSAVRGKEVGRAAKLKIAAYPLSSRA